MFPSSYKKLCECRIFTPLTIFGMLTEPNFKVRNLSIFQLWRETHKKKKKTLTIVKPI